MYCHTHIHTLYSWTFTRKRIQTGGFGLPELGVDGERGKKGKREIRKERNPVQTCDPNYFKSVIFAQFRH